MLALLKQRSSVSIVYLSLILLLAGCITNPPGRKPMPTPVPVTPTPHYVPMKN